MIWLTLIVHEIFFVCVQVIKESGTMNSHPTTFQLSVFNIGKRNLTLSCQRKHLL